MTLDEKLNANEESIYELNDKITNVEGKLAHFESQDELKSLKVGDLQQCRCRESLRFSGFEVKGNESKDECDRVVKRYTENRLKVDIKALEYHRIHGIESKIKMNGETFQQIIV